MPVTDFIEATETLLDHTVTTLAAGLAAGTTVQKYTGSSNQELLEDWVPGLVLPAVTVTIPDSSYQNRPRRNARLVLLACVQNPQRETGAVTARALADACIALLDDHVYNDAVWRVQRDAAVDISPTCACQMAEFLIEDH